MVEKRDGQDVASIDPTDHNAVAQAYIREIGLNSVDANIAEVREGVLGSVMYPEGFSDADRTLDRESPLPMSSEVQSIGEAPLHSVHAGLIDRLRSVEGLANSHISMILRHSQVTLEDFGIESLPTRVSAQDGRKLGFVRFQALSLIRHVDPDLFNDMFEMLDWRVKTSYHNKQLLQKNEQQIDKKPSPPEDWMPRAEGSIKHKPKFSSLQSAGPASEDEEVSDIAGTPYEPFFHAPSFENFVPSPSEEQTIYDMRMGKVDGIRHSWPEIASHMALPQYMIREIFSDGLHRRNNTKNE